MLFLFEFLFYLIFFLIKLYFFLDNNYIFSGQGRKLEKYVSSNILKNVTYNLGKRPRNVFNLKNFFMSIKSPIRSKQFYTFMLTSTTLVVIKTAISYSFLSSNFYYVSIFNKNIDLAYIFSNYYIFLKIIYYILFSFFIYSITYKIFKKLYKNDKKAKFEHRGDGIYIGTSSAEEKISINKLGLYQNILITGSIGTGKTSGAISNILEELMNKNISGLILDVKGNFIESVIKIARKCNREQDIIKISLNSDFIYNPLDKPDISSIELAHSLKKVLTLLSENNSSDSFWLDKAEEYIKSFIDIIRIYNDYVNFTEIHKLVTDGEYLSIKINQTKNMLFGNNYDDKTIFNTTMAINNILNEYMKLDMRTLGIIKAEITRITNIYVSDYIVNNKFDKKTNNVDFLNGKIYVMSINIAENSKLAKVIATYLKLDFQKQILAQKIPKESFFICDEYMEFANIEDAHFFSLSREYKCINVISVQSYISIINALKNENGAKVIIQNLVNKIWFRSDDVYTVQEIIKQIGKIDRERTNVSIAEGGQNSRYNFISKRFSSSKSSLSQTYSIIKNTEYMYNEEYFTQKLKTFEAVALISDGNKVEIIDKLKFKRWEE